MQVRDLIEELQRFDPRDNVRTDFDHHVGCECPECGHTVKTVHAIGEIDSVRRENAVVVLRLV